MRSMMICDHASNRVFPASNSGATSVLLRYERRLLVHERKEKAQARTALDNLTK